MSHISVVPRPRFDDAKWAAGLSEGAPVGKAIAERILAKMKADGPWRKKEFKRTECSDPYLFSYGLIPHWLAHKILPVVIKARKVQAREAGEMKGVEWLAAYIDGMVAVHRNHWRGEVLRWKSCTRYFRGIIPDYVVGGDDDEPLRAGCYAVFRREIPSLFDEIRKHWRLRQNDGVWTLADPDAVQTEICQKQAVAAGRSLLR